jgi:RNA polymerase primary sigma factor
MIMVKKHTKPARKTPAAGRGKPAAKKPAARKTPARKTSHAGKRPAAKHAAGGRKPVGKSAAAARTARAPAPKPKAAPKSKLAVKPPVKPAPAAKLDKPVGKPDKVIARPEKVVGKPDKATAKPGKVAGKADKPNGKPVTPTGGATAAKGAPARKPSPGEIAARIAGKRAEDAAHKKGRNGKHAEVAPRELTPADVEARKRRLKTLIVLGKERGYLTYAEINDHLPDDILDAEQIEGIISMIGDMGIQVYDEAPDAETLLMSETPATVPAEDVEEEAEAAASTLD